MYSLIYIFINNIERHIYINNYRILYSNSEIEMI